jgi:hypothetical protein
MDRAARLATLHSMRWVASVAILGGLLGPSVGSCGSSSGPGTTTGVPLNGGTPPLVDSASQALKGGFCPGGTSVAFCQADAGSTERCCPDVDRPAEHFAFDDWRCAGDGGCETCPDPAAPYLFVDGPREVCCATRDCCPDGYQFSGQVRNPQSQLFCCPTGPNLADLRLPQPDGTCAPAPTRSGGEPY